MQTECGLSGTVASPGQTGTEDGLAKYPYIRESRRIQAEFTVLEQHVGTDGAQERLKRVKNLRQKTFTDSVGVGSYRIDLHPSSGGDNYIDVSSLPFQIPLGALIPKRVENLDSGLQELGVTHITNGCYRLHPWNGTSASLPVRCRLRRAERMPAAADTKRSQAAGRLSEAGYSSQGVEIAWPRLTPR